MARADSSALEVLSPAEGEFLIGGVPALTISPDGGSFGVLGGVALDDAITVVMPFGPNSLAALAGSDLSAQLSGDQVDAMNEYQIRTARTRLLQAGYHAAKSDRESISIGFLNPARLADVPNGLRPYTRPRPRAPSSA